MMNKPIRTTVVVLLASACLAILSFFAFPERNLETKVSEHGLPNLGDSSPDSRRAGVSAAETALPSQKFSSPQPALHTTARLAPDFDPVELLAANTKDTSYGNLVFMLSDESFDVETRYLSAVAIGQSGKPGALEVLVAQLSNSDLRLQLGSLIGLGELRDGRAVQYAERILLAGEPEALKQAALAVLAKNISNSATTALVKSIELPEQSHDVRVTALEILGSSAGRDVDSVLRALSIDENPEIGARALVALSRRFGSEYDGALVDIIENPNLPSYSWTDVVRQLEVSSGTDFIGPGNANRAVFDSQWRLIVNSEIRTWYATEE